MKPPEKRGWQGDGTKEEKVAQEMG